MIPVNAILALAAAGLWGGGDFSGGMAVKHTSEGEAGGSLNGALRVILMSHAASFCVLVTVARLRGDAFPHGAALAWGVVAGLLGGISLALFYIALSRGAMGASAALSGLLAAAIPAMVSMGLEGTPGLRRVVGFCAAGVAIWLIAGTSSGTSEQGKKEDRGTLGLAIVSGAGFGCYFVALKFAGAAGVIWPMATARMGSLSLCSVLLLALLVKQRRGGSREGAGAQVRIGRGAVLWSLGTAVMDTSGNLLYIAATRAGRLDVASVLASLYPATTILLAAWTLKESPTRRQGLGMAVAVVAVLLITV